MPNTKIEVAESENLIEYAEDMYNVQSRKDPSEELSLFSQKANNPIIKSSLNGGVESSLRESRASSLSSHQDWFSTGLYNVFLLNYNKEKGEIPIVHEGKLQLTTLSKTLSDYIFDKYYEEKIQIRADRIKDILKDVHASFGLKYIKRGMKERYSQSLQDDGESSDDNKYKNESDEDFLDKVGNYFYLGMETLRYLMDLMNLNKNFQ